MENRLRISCDEPSTDGTPQRKRQLSTTGPKGKVDGLPTGLFGLALMNASMGVRVKHTEDDSDFDLLGSSVLDTLTDFLRDSTVQLQSEEGAKRFAAASIGDYEHFSKSGTDFENEVYKRLLMKALGAWQWRLSDLHLVPSLPSLHTSSGKPGKCNLWQLCGVGSDGRTTGVLAPMEEEHADFVKQAVRPTNALWRPAKAWKKAGSDDKTTQLLLQSWADQSSFVDEAVSTSVADCLQSGGRAVIKTSGNFPGVDFIHVESDKTRYSVTFVETTVSALHDHGGAPLPDVSLAPALRDLARLTRRKLLTAKHPDGRWWTADKEKLTTLPQSMQGDEWDLQPRQTPVDFWLQVLGCPLRITADTPVKANKAAKDPFGNRLVLQQSLPETKCSVHDAEEVRKAEEELAEAKWKWDVSVVYATCSTDQPVFGSYADLDCDFAYGVFLPGLDSALRDWVHQPSMPVLVADDEKLMPALDP